MADFVVKGATIVDGTGTPGFVGDVGVRAGRIEFVGEGDETGLEVIEGEGLVLTPGFVDPHSHPVFHGTREREFELRNQGRSYVEIAEAERRFEPVG